jgi:phosphohistidine phosphatase
MVNRLYFLRHGIAYEHDEWSGENDELRPLTTAGIAAMKREAKYLREHKIKVDAIVTSPLVRARDTAKIVAKAFDMEATENDLLKPGLNLTLLGKLLKEYAPAERIMVVGHEPDFSSIIGQMMGGGVIEMRKGGLARIDVTSLRPLRGTLVALLTPKFLDA